MGDVEYFHWIDILALREDLWVTTKAIFVDFTTEALRSQRGGSFFIRSGDDDQIKDQSAEGRWDMLLGLAQKKTSLCTSDKK